MSDTVSRFSNRVANYVKYRPSYPPEVLALFRDEMGLTADSVVADVGSGTGISARLFVENGNVVYGVEPNPAMRAAAEDHLRDFPNFRSVDGTAEDTTLESGSVDFVTAAQAFHWFEAEKTRAEFDRILRAGGHIALMWNERQLDSTPFLRDYEKFLSKYGKDYQTVRHENVTETVLEDFFRRPFAKATFDNVQVLDFEGLKGRMLSSSYMPAEVDPGFEEMVAELRSLFEKHSESGKIEVFYDTNVFFT